MKRLMAGIFALTAASALWADIPAVTPREPDSEWARSWWPKRFAEKRKLVQAGGAKYVFIGDSITQLFETGSGSEVWARYFGPKGVYPSLNLGYSGDRTEHVLYRIANGELDGYEAELVVLMIGTNNTGHRTLEEEAPADTIIGVKRCVDAIRAKQPKAKVVLCAIFPRDAEVNGPSRVRNAIVNREIRKFADGRHVIWCDINQRFLRPDGHLPAQMMPDRLHPGALGYEIWANALLPYFEGSSAATYPAFVMAGELEGEGVAPLVPQSRFQYDWWLEKIARNRNRIADLKGGEIDIVMMGDSITHYWEIGEGLDESRDIEILEKKYSIMNCGYGGDQVQHLLWRVKNGERDGFRTKLVTVMIGTNNSSGNSPDEIARGIRNLIGEIYRKQPQAKILLTALLPRGKDSSNRNRRVCEAVNKVIETYKNAQTVKWFDFGDRFVNADGTAKLELFDDEILHPSTEGYRVWREALEPVLKDLLGK